ncbi:MAG: glycosyltransferase family 1 protein [Acidobacteria bacterium]|nr:glycosyltransferase family 1 protein [Acidobacteriota bacterium]
MRIAIDIRRIEDFGVGTYIRNLVQKLAARGSQNDYFLLGDQKSAENLLPLPGNFRVLHWNGSGRLWRAMQLHQLIRSSWIDLLHIPYLQPVLLSPCPYLMTVHDLADFLYTSQTGWRQRLRVQMTRRTMMNARRILAVSSATQRDIENLFAVPGEKISVIANALDERFLLAGRLSGNLSGTISDDMGNGTGGQARREEIRLVQERYGVQDPFLLYVGSARPQKNLPRLIEAFAVVKGELLAHPTYQNLKLLIIGDELSEHPELRHTVLRTRMQTNVRFLGFLPQEILRIFYQSAEVFVFPSLHEGFGLPPLEAMSMGTPVVTSNVSSLPEVVGDAAVTVHPENVFDIARGIQRALTDEALRAQLRARGHQQIQRFSWDRSVDQVLEIYAGAAA